MPDERDVLRQFAEWADGVALAEIPGQALATAKRSILDCIGVTIAAADEPLAAVIDRVLGESPAGSASVIGRQQTVDAETAALLNGAQAHALDFDDVSHTMGGHPTIPALMAALAVAEERNASAGDLLRAYCIGVEVETAIGRGVNFTHYDKGWHPTATLGTFGAAAAAAAVRGLSTDQTTAALALAATMASGLKASFGTMAKPLQVGHAASSGVLAARLAAAGATAADDAMSAKQGFAMVYNGEGTFDLAAMTSGLGSPWDLVDPGIAIKLHPCCGGTHAAVDAAIELHEAVGDPARIVSVEAAIHGRRFAHLDRPNPDNPLDAKFSLQHTVALALMNGVIRVTDFNDDELRNAATTQMRSRVIGRPLPPEREGAEHFAAEVEVTLDDGTRLSRRWERPRGRTAETALSDADIHGKFDACTSESLDSSERAKLIALVDELDRGTDLADLSALLRLPADRTVAV